MPAAVDLLAQPRDLARLRIDLAQLPLDRLELLAEEVLALRLVDLFLHLASGSGSAAPARRARGRG